MIGRDGSVAKIKHECILVPHKKQWDEEGGEGYDNNTNQQNNEGRVLMDDVKWDVVDLDGKNTQIKGATTCFIRNEIYRGRIVAEPGWDNNV